MRQNTRCSCDQSKALHHRYSLCALNNQHHAANINKNNKIIHQNHLLTVNVLIPIPINTLTSILPTPTNLTPTGDQYVTYLGHTPKQRTSMGFGELASMTDFCVLDIEIDDVEEYGPEAVV